MRGSQLAKALADITSRRPELEADLAKHLQKWVKSTLMKGAQLEALRTFHEAAGAAFIDWHLDQQVEKDLVALTKKLDPHLPGLKGRDAQALRSHLAHLCAKRIDPTPKPAKPPSAPKGRPIEEILRLSNAQQRQAELEKLSPKELKAAIKNHDLSGGGLSSRPTKVEMIAHIQARLASGWPSTTRVLDESKY